MPRRLILPLLVTLALGAGDVPEAGAADQAVTIARYAFAPERVTVRQGERVTWTFAGPDTDHSVTAAAGQADSFDSDFGRKPTSLDHPPGSTYARRFDVPGTFGYFCKTHPGMRGTVVVQGDKPATDAVAPVLSGVRVIRTTAGPRLRLALSEAARVLVTLRRGRDAPRRLIRALPPGPSRVALPRRLPVGRYSVTVDARDAAGNAAARRQLTIVVPRRR